MVPLQSHSSGISMAVRGKKRKPDLDWSRGQKSLKTPGVTALIASRPKPSEFPMRNNQYIFFNLEFCKKKNKKTNNNNHKEMRHFFLIVTVFYENFGIPSQLNTSKAAP